MQLSQYIRAENKKVEFPCSSISQGYVKNKYLYSTWIYQVGYKIYLYKKKLLK